MENIVPSSQAIGSKRSHDVNNISKLYLKMIKIEDYPWEALLKSFSNGTTTQSDLVRSTIYHPISKKYSPSSRYLKLFLKTLVNKLEKEGIEVDGNLYHLFINSLSNINKDDYFYRTYTLDEDLKITLQETNSLIVDGTTGLTTWQASHAFIEYCESNNFEWSNTDVLEVGCGLGLTGIATIKKYVPNSYTFTDHHFSVLKCLKRNLEINFNNNEDEFMYNNCRILVQNLNWNCSESLAEEKYDVLIGSDVLFDPSLFKALLKTIIRLLKSQESKAYIAATIRNSETITEFENEINESLLTITNYKMIQYQESFSAPIHLVKVMTLQLR